MPYICDFDKCQGVFIEIANAVREGCMMDVEIGEKERKLTERPERLSRI